MSTLKMDPVGSSSNVCLPYSTWPCRERGGIGEVDGQGARGGGGGFWGSEKWMGSREASFSTMCRGCPGDHRNPK